MAPQGILSDRKFTLEPYFESLSNLDPARVTGRVRRVAGLIAECEGLSAPVGAVCAIQPSAGPALRAEVVGFRDDATLLMPFGEVTGVRRGDDVVCLQTAPRVAVGDALLGRVLDAEGNCSTARAAGPRRVAPALRPGPLAARPRPRPEPLATGVRAIDACTCGGRGRLFSDVPARACLRHALRRASADVVVVAGWRARSQRSVNSSNWTKRVGRGLVVVETAGASRPPGFRAEFCDGDRRHFRVAAAMSFSLRTHNDRWKCPARDRPRRGAARHALSAFGIRDPARCWSAPGLEAAVTGYSVLVEGDDLKASRTRA
jgi:flagellar biosynthesis/type III secretory pathway ATPase